MKSQPILITGASGLVGTRLTEMLIAQGHTVAHLGRSARNRAGVKSYVWNVDDQQMDAAALTNTTTIVHLAGASVAEKRWTASRKREILESRTRSTQLLYDTLKKGNHSVKSFVSASAIGYYGFEDNDTLLTEDYPAGKDFMADVTKQWEEAVDRIATLGIRVVKLRIGIVLSEKGGALVEIARPVRWGVGAPLGSGDQHVSWIHIDDLCAMFIRAIENESMLGAYNATGPYAVTNRELTRAIARTIHRPMFMPAVPGFALRMVLGEMADVVLTGSRVSSGKFQDEGFVFRFDTLEKALHDLLR